MGDPEIGGPSEAQLRDAIDSLPAAVMLFDREERFVFCNRRHLQTFPQAGEQLARGMTMEQLLIATAESGSVASAVGREREYVAERLAQFRRGDTDLEQAWTDGRWFYLFERRTAGGGAVSIRFDITARKKVEEQLRESQKLEALGQLTGGVAHDFNNLLAVVSGNLELVDEALLDRPELQRKLRAAMRATERGAALTRGLLAFARRQALDPQSLDLNGLISDMAELLRRTVPANIAIELVLDPATRPCLADPGQLQNAVLNLVVNAQDAMPQGGRLRIETASERLEAPLAAEAHLPAGAYARVSVRDTGAGMDPAVLARAFEPFFTTKPRSKGTGLGLSMVYGFAKQSGGHARIESRPGQGTAVTLYLPASGATPIGLEVLSAVGPHQARGESILIVEDDQALRAVISEVLSALGYTLREAGDAKAGLDILAGKAPIDLLIADVVLPGGMNGLELAAEAARLRPGIAVICMSGYAETTAQHRAIMTQDLLRKPFHNVELAARVRAELDKRR